MLDMILEGLSWGLFIVAAIVPVAAFSVAWSYLGPMLRKEREEDTLVLAELFEEPPELPEAVVEPEPEQEYRFTASTIVRPPNVVRREDVEDED